MINLIRLISTITFSGSLVCMMFSVVVIPMYFLLPYLGDVKEPLFWLGSGALVLIVSGLILFVCQKVEEILEKKDKKKMTF